MTIRCSCGGAVVIDGIWPATIRTPVSIAWTCLVCHTSGGSPYLDGDEDQRREARQKQGAEQPTGGRG